jgi:membrane protein YqaA with SNARE-associated domain
VWTRYLMKLTSKTFKRILFVSLLIFMVGFLYVFVFHNPVEIITMLGIRNSYMLAFFVSVIGAFTSLTKFSAYPMIVALVAGRLDPLLVGFISGLGLAAGDILFFLFGYSARDLTSDRAKTRLSRILKKLQSLKDIYIQIIIFLYVAGSPFPNNLLSGALAYTGYPFKKVFIPLMFGDIVFCILIAWLAVQGIKLF